MTRSRSKMSQVTSAQNDLDDERGGGVRIVVEDVKKSFESGRVKALRGISFQIEPGEFVALTGPSGCGKSTLLNLIGGLDSPDSGSISVGDQLLENIANPANYRANTVGFVFQLHNLIPTLNALENVQVPMFGRRMTKGHREEIAHELLNEVGLSERERALPKVLSGGERQRVAIARALANDPILILADEPTGSLDSATGDQIMHLLGTLREQRGTTILLVTNDNRIAESADRTLRMRDGVIQPA